MENVPATVLKLLGFTPPSSIPSAVSLENTYRGSQVVCCMIDNFGLFEAVVYKPEALIKNMEALALLETTDPYALPLIKRLLKGHRTDFHLLRHVKNNGKTTKVICREEDMVHCDFDPSYTVRPRDDMATYIEATKHIFKTELLYLHFLDFESLYAQYGHRTPPKTLLEKIVRRTDNWIKVLLKQARVGTLFIVIGNHGRHPIPLNYEGKLAEWRKANAPIAIMFQKREE